MNKTLPVAILRNLGLAAIIVAAFCPIKAVAVPTYYVPGSNINFTGGSNSFPLNSTSSNKCQFLYKTVDFNASPGSAYLITTVYIKPSSTKSNAVIPNLTIKLANSTLTTLTAGPWLTGLTTVYSPSSVTVSTTANQWKAFTLSTPFLYTGGNLLLEISQTSSTTPGISINQYTVTGRNGRAYGGVSSSSSSGAGAQVAVFGFDGMPASCSGTPTAPVITTAAMTAASPLCAGNTKALSATDPNAPITNITYQWQRASSSTGPFTNVTNGSGATTLNYTTGPLTTSTWFRMGAKCVSSAITSYSAPYQVRVGAQQPGTISGRPSSCPGDTASYSVPAVAGHSYTWSLPSGWTGNATANSIHVTMGTAGGTISVTANGCGAPSTPQTKTVVTGSAPSQPAAINGTDKICAGSTQTYSVMPVSGATSYSWSIPAGWTGSSTTNSITVMPGSTSGNVKVKASNGCGNSLETIKPITVITSLPSPGTITSSAVGGLYCSGALYNFSISPVPGATSYQWSLPAGWSGTISGTSIQAIAGSSGQIHATALVSCATSPSANLTTTVSQTVTPSVSIAPNASLLCGGKPVTFTATATNSGSTPLYVWKRNGVTVLGSGGTYTSASLANGDQISVAMISSASCRSVDTARSTNYTANITPSVTPGISINSNPVITICAGTRLNFQTLRTGTGSAPTYEWRINKVAVAGATDTSFSSATFADGDTLTVVMTSNAVCATMPQTTSNQVGIIVNPVVQPKISVIPSSVLAGQPITFTSSQTGGGATPDYQWLLNNTAIPGADGDIYTSSGLSAGDRIAVRMLSYAECAQPMVVTSDEIEILGTTGVATYKGWEGTLSIFPNPNTGRFTIASELPAMQVGQTLQVEVYNMLGQRVYQDAVVPGQSNWRYEVQLGSAQTVGHYTLRLSAANGGSVNVPLLLVR